jgi:hypothetical protein
MICPGFAAKTAEIINKLTRSSLSGIRSSTIVRLRRWLIPLIAGMFILATLWMGTAMLVTACGVIDDMASARIDGSRDVLELRRRPIWHPILTNEYHRHLSVTQAGLDMGRVDLSEESGGGSLRKSL